MHSLTSATRLLSAGPDHGGPEPELTADDIDAVHESRLLSMFMHHPLTARPSIFQSILSFAPLCALEPAHSRPSEFMVAASAIVYPV
jgi:hypothetical protein